MYRVLIIDDEPMLADSLLCFLESVEELDLDLHKAYSAIEALAFLKSTRVDIILSDISMPGMTGIELHSKVVKLWPYCKTILITGYSNIEYAQEAIRNGNIVDYIMKNEEDELIVKAIYKAIKMIDDDINETDFLNRLKQGVQSALPLLRKDFFTKMLQGFILEKQSREQSFNDLTIPLEVKRGCFIMVGRMDIDTASLDYRDLNMKELGVQQIIYRYYSDQIKIFSIIHEPGEVVCFVQTEEENAEHFANYLREIAELVQATCRKMLSVSLSLIISKRMSSWENISARYRILSGELRRNAALLEGALLIEGIHDNNNYQHTEAYHNKRSTGGIDRFNQLEKALYSGNINQFISPFHSFIGIEDIESSVRRFEVLCAMQAFFVRFLKQVNLLDSFCENEDMIRLLNFDDKLSWSSMINRFQQLAEIICSKMKDQDREYAYKILNSVEEYVNNNLSDELSLTRMGEVFYYSPSYFSKLFKSLKGINFIDYVTGKRFEKARELLMTTNKKINDISCEVGYSSSSYFIRAFKKEYSISPQEYRSRIQE